MDASLGIWLSTCVNVFHSLLFVSLLSFLALAYSSCKIAEVLNSSDLVHGLIVADHLDVIFAVHDQRQDFAWFLQVRLILACECELNVRLNLLDRACLVVQSHAIFNTPGSVKST